MSTLLAMLALIGQPVALVTDLGTCEGVVVAPGRATLDGTCALDPGGALVLTGADPTRQDGDPVGMLTLARTLPSGRVLVTFEVVE